ncbi:hypothetical protein GN956_G26233 [Arapaima gigas]
MDANPAFSLLLLYKNDPIYSLCAPDLMSASQKVNNSFLKEQKELAETLRRLEQEKLNRLRQLNEEKKQFAFIMRKRLSPRGTGSSTTSKLAIPDRLSQTSSSTTMRSTVLTSRSVSSHLPHSSIRFQTEEGPKVPAASRRCVWKHQSSSAAMQQHAGVTGAWVVRTSRPRPNFCSQVVRSTAVKDS